MNHGLEKQQHESTKPRVKEVNGKKQDPTIDSLALIPSGDPLVRKKKKNHDMMKWIKEGEKKKTK